MPISNLTEDTLLRIFSTCSEVDWDGDMPAYHGANDNWDWIAITHVSKLWRNLAISSPLIWCKPAMARHSRNRLKTFLERSQEAPLTICSYSSCDNDYTEKCEKCKGNVIFALGHLNHIGRLIIYDSSSDIISAMVDKAAPMLEEMVLCPYHHLFTERLLLPDNFHKSYTPSLKRLVLHSYRPSYNSSILRGLKLLKLDNPFYMSATYIMNDVYPLLKYHLYPTMQELLDILVSSPDLESLSLFTIRQPLDGLARSGWSKVFLAELSSMTIHEMDIPTFRDLLSYIGVPSFTRISLGLRYTNINEFPYILSALKFIIDRRVFNSLDLTFLDCRAWGGIGTDLEMNPKGGMYSGQPSLHLVHTDETGHPLEDNDSVDYDEIFGIMKSLIDLSRWKSVTNLIIRASNHYYTLDEEQWTTLFDTLKAVQYLAVMTCYVIPNNPTLEEIVDMQTLQYTILTVLTPRPEHTRTRSTLMLPLMTRLLLRISTAIDYELLLRCMEVRKEHGIPVQELAIHIKMISMARDYIPIPPGPALCEELEEYVERIICSGG